MAKVTTSLHGDIALLPLQAEVPVRETIEWLTDLTESKNGTELATQVRSTPRHRYSFRFPAAVDSIKRAAMHVQYSALRSLWGVPLWTEGQYVGALAGGSSVISAEVDLFDFRADSLAFLWQSAEEWEVVEVASVGSGQLNLASPTVEAFSRAWLMPLRVGYISGSSRFLSSGYSADSEITFEIEDTLALAESTPDQFLGEDIYFDTPPLLEGDALETEIKSRSDVIDFELGRVSRRAPWTYNRLVRPHRFLATSATEHRDFKRWLARRRGRARRYWEPSFEPDLRLRSTGAIGTTVVVDKDGYLDWTPAERLHAAFQLDDGSWLARTLSAPTALSTSTMQFTLSSSLGVNASRVKMISWLGLRRLDQDRVEISWLGNNVAQSTVNVVEVQP